MLTRILLSSILFSLCGFIQAQSVATIYTKIGEIEVYLEDTLAPITAGNFIGLSDQKYYDGVLIHRVVSNFVIQGGDATLTGGSKAPVISDEFHASLSNVKGTLSMANSGPNTGTSQFFVNLKDNTFLDFNKTPATSKHPVFGHVIKGMSVVDSIGRVAKNAQGRPTVDVVMDSIRITSRYNPNTGVLPISLGDELKVFPNPSKGYLTIESIDEQPLNVTLFNMNGQLVFGEHCSSGQKILDLSGIENGLYILQIVWADSRIQRSNLIIQQD